MKRINKMRITAVSDRTLPLWLSPSSVLPPETQDPNCRMKVGVFIRAALQRADGPAVQKNDISIGFGLGAISLLPRSGAVLQSVYKQIPKSTWHTTQRQPSYREHQTQLRFQWSCMLAGEQMYWVDRCVSLSRPFLCDDTVFQEGDFRHTKGSNWIL